tara:strand:+ start:6776 stop:8176 length:1401 start_codon:yes stop_codon:yes gene_type:complete
MSKKRFVLVVMILVLLIISSSCSISNNENIDVELNVEIDSKDKESNTKIETDSIITGVAEVISFRKAPLIGDSNDIIKFKILIEGEGITNPILEIIDSSKNTEEFEFSNDGLHNDNLADDNVYVAWIGPLKEGEYTASLKYTINEEIIVDPVYGSSKFNIIEVIDLECQAVIDNNGEINIVIVTVGYGGTTEELAKQIFDYEEVYDGIMSVEPFASNKELFNLWVVDQTEIDLTQYPLLQSAVTIDEQRQAYGQLSACDLENQYNIFLYDHPSEQRTGIGALGYVQISPSEDFSLMDDTSNFESLIQTTVHEFGHAFGDLTDEYVTGFGIIGESPDHEQCYESKIVECVEQEYEEDVSSGSYCIDSEEALQDCYENSPWSDLIGNGCGEDGVIDCVLSTEESIGDEYYNLEVGCFLGCGQRLNTYRSNYNNIMRSTSANPYSYGLVNEIEICEKIKLLVDPNKVVC